MDRFRRIGVLLLLVGIWTASLLVMAYPARAQARDGEGTVHVVEAGQTLNQIARQYGTDVRSLQQLNDLTNADLLYVGQRLYVQSRADQEQPRWEDDAAQPSERNTRPAGSSWEPQTSQEGYRRAGMAWEPESSESTYPSNNQRAGAAWEPSSEDNYRRPGSSWEPQAAQRNARPPVSDWESEEWESNGYPAGTSWEPEPPRVRREAELSGEKWIDIDLSDQRLIAYQGDTAVRFFTISSGSAETPTVTGSFRIYSRTEVQDMSGGSVAAGTDYFQPDVPWVQYFYQDYAIHGAYWHNRFGTPVGHGCINMRVEDSRWLYDWTGSTGARVEVHQ